MDEAVHRRARPRAAELNPSLSALVKAFLEELAGDESEAHRLRHQQNELLQRPAPLRTIGHHYRLLP